MATEQQLKSALLQAHNAGDTQAAQLFADKIKAMRANVQSPPVEQPSFAAENVTGASPRARRASESRQESDFNKEQVLASMSPEERWVVESQSPLDAFLTGAGRGLN